jgi:hypothetical protein
MRDKFDAAIDAKLAEMKQAVQHLIELSDSRPLNANSRMYLNHIEAQLVLIKRGNNESKVA